MANASTTKHNGSGEAADLDALNAQIGELRKDLSDLVGIVGTMGSNASSSAADSVHEQVARLAAKADDAKTEAELRAMLMKEKTQDAVHENPGTSLLIATGIGFLVGAFLTKR